MNGRAAALILVLGTLLGGGTALGQPAVVVTPEETDEILANPGMGWETFHHTSRQDETLPAWIPSTVHYARWGWGELGAAAGPAQHSVSRQGAARRPTTPARRLAFRVMCCSTTPPRTLPTRMAQGGRR